jgi:F-type H+-transporting ATPase subunit gamma
MSESKVGLRRQIDSASDLQSVVRTMRAIAASSIHAYQQSVRALADYHRAVELGLGACLREGHPTPWAALADKGEDTEDPIVAIVFGSDQGLVGPFNDVLVEHVLHTLSTLRGNREFWAVGERVCSRLADAGLSPLGGYAVPNSVEGIAPLVGRIQLDTEAHREQLTSTRLLVFNNRPQTGALYGPVVQRLLPLDLRWQQRFVALRWPTHVQPEVMGPGASTLRTLIREYLFISLFRSCAESLASENASRLAAMERADKNIDELLAKLRSHFHRLRQGSIDAELFDVTAGFEALS